MGERLGDPAVQCCPKQKGRTLASLPKVPPQLSRFYLYPILYPTRRPGSPFEGPGLFLRLPDVPDATVEVEKVLAPAEVDPNEQSPSLPALSKLLFGAVFGSAEVLERGTVSESLRKSFLVG
jgi:hypothetical protein